MNYAQIRKYDTANGTGIRTTLFVSGCTHNCFNCFNKDYQSFSYGKELTDKEIQEIIKNLSLDCISGLTILGGEPFQQNPKEMIDMLEKIRKNSMKSIWIYSGYTYEEILQDEGRKKILSYCDILVDGRYEESLKNLRLKFRGSSNQRIIDVQESLRQGSIVDISENI